jgi:hypothetical protein
MINREPITAARNVRCSHNLENQTRTSPSSRRYSSHETVVNDDLIMSLANAYENIRARQVTEWEGMRRQTVQHNA